MRHARFLIIIGLIVFPFLSACGATTASPPGESDQTIVLSECQLSSPGFQTRLPARCGKVSVFEDRQSATGRQMDLNIAVIPAVSRNPAPDPVFILAGGPGQAATESYQPLVSAFDRINQKREIILVDQRGTGKSNPLVCKSEQTNSLDLEDEDLIPWLQSCLESTTSRPEFFTTPIAMQDLDQVRRALGYEKINLYGVSYGTRAALTYLAAFPEHVRTVILDGVVPQDEVLGLEVARDAQRALDMIFDRCATEEACRRAFPNVRQDFAELLDNLEQNPVTLEVAHPSTGEETEIEFTPAEFSVAVRLLSYAPETAALLPLLIHTTNASNDYQLIAAQYLIVVGELTESISNGMGYSVLCTEDVPFMTEEEAASANANTYLGNTQTDELFRLCQVWPKGTVAQSYKQPVHSDLPVLVLSGEADPVTPPSNGEKTVQTLTNSLHLVAPGQGHNVLFRGCIPRIAADFIEQGSLEGLETECINEIKPMPFFINFAGPNP